jgi:hypothetical protein
VNDRLKPHVPPEDDSLPLPTSGLSDTQQELKQIAKALSDAKDENTKAQVEFKKLADSFARLAVQAPKSLLLLHMWKDFPSTVQRGDIARIMAGSLGLSLAFVDGFSDAWNYYPSARPDDADYADGFECGGCRNEIDDARRDGDSRN